MDDYLSSLEKGRLHERAKGARNHIKYALEEAEALRGYLGRSPIAREVALVITKLEEAQLWLRSAREKLPEEDEYQEYDEDLYDYADDHEPCPICGALWCELCHDYHCYHPDEDEVADA